MFNNPLSACIKFSKNYPLAIISIIAFSLIVSPFAYQHSQRNTLMATIDKQIEQVNGMDALAQEIGIFYAEKHYQYVRYQMGVCFPSRKAHNNERVKACLMSYAYKARNPEQLIMNSILLTGHLFITPDELPIEWRERASSIHLTHAE